MLASIRSLFEDAIWELPKVTRTFYDCWITPPDFRRKLFDDFLTLTNERKRTRFQVKGRGSKKKITDRMIVYIAIKSLDRKPSKRAVAKSLGVTRKTLRNWLKEQGLSDLDDLIKEMEVGKK
jgi:CENP-B N-terminal DNA-binding domain